MTDKSRKEGKGYGRGPDSPELKALKEKFPCPKVAGKEYRQIWYELVNEVTNRELFKPSDLRLLEMLVDMYMEKKQIEKVLAKHGHIYFSGEHNDIMKPRPEVNILAKLRTEIRNYHKALGIGNRPFADAAMTSQQEQDEWA